MLQRKIKQDFSLKSIAGTFIVKFYICYYLSLNKKLMEIEHIKEHWFNITIRDLK